MSIEERAGPLAWKPEMATLNCGSLNFGDDVFVNTRPEIRKMAAQIRAAGAVPELECYEVGHVEEALALAREGAILAPLHFQFVLGVPGGIGAHEDVMRFMRSLLPAEATWAVAAVGRHQQPMTELAMRMGGHARVGLEDNIYWSKGVLSEGSAPLVARAAAYARSIGRTPVDPARARELLGLAAG
jgi:3-keto-5-aminohexanoate cleavage enzyme